VIYLDNSATSWPKPDAVRQALVAAHDTPQSAGRSTGSLGDYVLQQTRRLIQETMGDSHIVFTLNCTDALNMALLGLGLRSGDQLVISDVEHNAVARTAERLRLSGVDVVVAPTDDCGRLQPEVLSMMLTDRTKAVCLAHASNVLGAVNDLDSLVSVCRDRQVTLIADAAQTAGEVDYRFMDRGVDLLATSGHKGLLGPSGVGILCVRKGRELVPYRVGGTGTQSESLQQPRQLPSALESGTPNVIGIAGLAAAISWSRENPDRRLQAGQLLKRALEGLVSMKHVSVYGTLDARQRVPLVSFNVKGWDPMVAGEVLRAKHGIITRTGLHCAPMAHRKLTTFPQGTIRISLGPFNAEDDVDRLLQAVWAMRGVC